MPTPTLAHVNMDELAQFREIQQLAYQCVERSRRTRLAAQAVCLVW